MASLVHLLKKAPRASFDTLYPQQVSEDAPAMWALNKGYASDGADPSLHQMTATTMPAIEAGYSAARGLTPVAAMPY